VFVIRRERIAANRRHILPQHMRKGRKLRLTDVIELFKLCDDDAHGSFQLCFTVCPRYLENSRILNSGINA
jgi:hypothetical protein